jgi:hypothetical protein
MGFRIMDRVSKAPIPPIADDIETELIRFLNERFGENQQVTTDLIARYRPIRDLLLHNHDAEDQARKVSRSIKDANASSEITHGKLNIANILELL